MTTSKSTSALNPSRRLPATQQTLSRSRRFSSEADLTRFARVDDPGRARFGPDTALMLVDVQPMYWSLAPEIREGFPDFEKNISTLLASREAGSPIIHVKASYSDGACPWLKQFRRLNPGRRVYEMDPDDVEPSRKPQDGEIIVNKDTFGAFIHASRSRSKAPQRRCPHNRLRRAHHVCLCSTFRLWWFQRWLPSRGRARCVRRSGRARIDTTLR